VAAVPSSFSTTPISTRLPTRFSLAASLTLARSACRPSAFLRALVSSRIDILAYSTVIVHESVADALGQRLKAHFDQKTADGQTSKMKAWADSPSLRGLFTTASAQRLHEWVGAALKEGAEILTGTHHCEGNVIQPVILHKVTKNMSAWIARCLSSGN